MSSAQAHTVQVRVLALDRDPPAVDGDRACRRLVRDEPPSRIPMVTAFHKLIARIRLPMRRGPGTPAVRGEFGVLECLAGAGGAVVSAEPVGRFRRKPGEPPLTETVFGVGYRL